MSFRTKNNHAARFTFAALKGNVKMSENSKEFTIAKVKFNLAPRYAEGHVLTANEANAMNQTFFENIRNNLSKLVKESLDPNSEKPLTVEELQTKVDEYAAAYVFGAGRSTSNAIVRDPVDKEALRLARNALAAYLKKIGKKKEDLTEEAYDNALAKIANSEEIRKQAQTIVDAANAANEITSTLSDMGITE